MTRNSLRTLVGAFLVVGSLGEVIGNFPGQPAMAGSPRCDAAPRSYANISFLLGTAPSATPAATTGGETLERGVPATAAERQAMQAVVDEWLACQNAGQLFSAWALFSDAYLYRLISRQPAMTEALYDNWATPQPTGAETANLLEISGERRLSDGRLGAMVRISYASVPMPKQFFFYFVAQDGNLLIDSILGEISFSVP